jgi:excisionase family DNA binding protein
VKQLAFTLPPELVEAIAQRAAEIVLEQLAERAEGEWPEYMTPQQAGRYIGATAQRIYDLRSAGRLPRAFNDGGRALIKRSDLDEYVALRSPPNGRGRSGSRAAA